MLSLSSTVFAAESTTAEQEISAIPEDIVALHQQGLYARNAGATTYNEFELLQAIKAQTDDELIEQGYSAEVIADMRNGVAEERILTGTLERAKLPEEQLLKMGYTATEVAALKGLTGNETLEEISTMGILADCTTYNTLVSHIYKTSKGKTLLP
jgi:hypothetical protein